MSGKRDSEDALTLLQDAARRYSRNSCGQLDYQGICEDLQALSGATYVVINEVSEDKQYTVTRAIAGVPAHIERAAGFIGFKLIGASYRIDEPVSALFDSDGIVDLGTVCNVTGAQLPELLCRKVAEVFGLRRVYGIGLHTGSGPLATVMFLCKEEEPANREYVELLCSFAAVCIERKMVENDYLSRVFELEYEKGGGVDSALLALRRAAETVPDILYQLDRDGNIVFINQAINRYGYERGDLIGKSILELVHPDDREVAGNKLKERRTGARRTMNYEIRLLTGSRNTTYFTFHTRPIVEPPLISISAEGLYRGDVEHGNFIGTIGVGHDITEKKLMENEIADRERLFRHIADRVGEAVWLEERNPFRLVYVNPACRDLFGLSDEDFDDPQGWLSRVHPDDREKIERCKEAGSEEGEYCEYRIHLGGAGKGNPDVPEENVGVRWLRSRVLPLDSGDEEPKSFVGIAVDITAEKREKRELERRVAAGEAFVREVNHRVKNNLAMLDSMLNLQLQRYPEASEEKDLIMEVKSRMRAVGLVHEKLYHGYEQRYIDVSSYLTNLGNNILQSGLRDPSRIQAEYHIPQVNMVMDTAIPMGMIFSELMTNVIKYAFPEERRGKVRVTFENVSSEDREGLADRYRLTVADNGVGLPEDYERRKEEGIGHLLVDSLAEQINGDFEVDGGDGETRFSVVFTPSV